MQGTFRDGVFIACLTASRTSRIKSKNWLKYLQFCSNHSPWSTTSADFLFSPFAIWLLRMRCDSGHILFHINHEGWRWCSHNEKLKLSHDDTALGAGALLYTRYGEVVIEIQRAESSEDAAAKQDTIETLWRHYTLSLISKCAFSRSTRGWVSTSKEHFIFSFEQQVSGSNFPKQWINII